MEKTVTSLTPLLLGLLLVAGRTTEHQAGVRLAGLAAGLLTFCGFLVFRRYRLEDDPAAASTASASTSAT